MELENANSSLHKFYLIYEKVLFFRRYDNSEHWLVCIPEKHQLSLIMSIHEMYGHVGARNTAAILKEICSFPNLNQRVRCTVARCDLCQRTKHRTIRAEGVLQSTLSTNSLDKVLVDINGPLPAGWNGVSFIFFVHDNFTRFVKLYPLKRTTVVATTNRMIDHYISVYDKPKLIVSDHGV